MADYTEIFKLMTNMTSQVWSSSDSDVIGRKLIVEADQDATEDLDDFYEINTCIDWITGNNFKAVALQFPDILLHDATEIAMKLKKNTGIDIYILGDTSYGSCCVDEVAAEHVSADSIIHFGHSCLSKTLRLPVLFIHGKKFLNIQNADESIKNLINDQNEKMILIYDTIYAHKINGLFTRLSTHFNSLILSQLETTTEKSENSLTKLGRLINLPKNSQIDEYSFIYIGDDDATLANFMLTFNKNKFYTYNPRLESSRHETLNVNKTLMKRYYLVERTRDANIIGILVGTLGIENYLSIISHLKNVIRKSGKKAYTLAMGKINVTKLANFPEIDVICLVACPENSMIDSKEFFRPIVTPYEVELACNLNREWTGDYVADFRELLPGAVNFVELNGGLSEEPSMSLVTGSVRALKLEESAESGQVVLRNDALQLAEIHQNAAGEFLNKRSWTGLQQKLGETEVTKASKGRSGIACQYENESNLYN